MRRAAVWDPDARRRRGRGPWGRSVLAREEADGRGRFQTDPNVLSPAARPSHPLTSSEGAETSRPHSSLHTGVSAALFTAAQAGRRPDGPAGDGYTHRGPSGRRPHSARSVNELQARRRHGGSFTAHLCVGGGHSRDDPCGSSTPSTDSGRSRGCRVRGAACRRTGDRGRAHADGKSRAGGRRSRAEAASDARGLGPRLRAEPRSVGSRRRARWSGRFGAVGGSHDPAGSPHTQASPPSLGSRAGPQPRRGAGNPLTLTLQAPPSIMSHTHPPWKLNSEGRAGL